VSGFGRVNWAGLALAFAVGLAGGLLADLAGLPLPMLLGSVVSVGALGISPLRPFGVAPEVPFVLRQCFVPIIGVSIGSAVTPAVLSEAPGWWPSLIAVAIFIPTAHLMSFALMRRVGGIDKVTAFYGSAPGGLIETVVMGEEAGADAALLAALQFLRLILTIILVPIGFTILTGTAVGSGGGAVIGAGYALSAGDWAILAACGVVGAIAGKRIGLPAGLVMGPFILSGLVHLLGWVEGAPPSWLLSITQLVIGTSLGARFVGRPPSLIWQAIRVSLVSVLAILALAGAVAYGLSGVIGERWEAVFLAFAPGGLAEMALIALSLETSVIYVTIHHVMRIMLAVTVAKLLSSRIHS
jgi:membrane AbrB-like protein